MKYEAQILYAIELNVAAPPNDKTYAMQFKGAAILEPIFQRQPRHPGVAHYLIHLASRLRLVFHPIWTPRASVFGPISKTLIVISDSQHRVFRFGIIHLMREIA